VPAKRGIGITILCKRLAPGSGPYDPLIACYSSAETVNAANNGRMLPLEIVIHPEGSVACEDQAAEAAE
jgi:hypothetical protein